MVVKLNELREISLDIEKHVARKMAALHGVLLLETSLSGGYLRFGYQHAKIVIRYDLNSVHY